MRGVTDKPRRIVMVTGEFPKISETFIVNKFLRLLQKGWDIHIVCRKMNQEILDQFPALKENHDCLKKVYLEPPSGNKMLAALLFPFIFMKTLVLAPAKSAEYLARGVKESGFSVLSKFYLDSVFLILNPDVIHFEFGALAVGRTHLKKLLKNKLSVSFRGYDLNFSGKENKNYYSEVWKQADAFHFLGKDLWERALKRGCPPDKIRALIPPAADFQFFTPAKKNREEQNSKDRPARILSVGRLEWKKGYEFGLKAVGLLKQRGINFTYRIIGEGEYLEALAFCRHQLNVAKETEFLGALGHLEIVKHLQWADLLIHSAVSEGFCNAVLEAQAMELPVVCSDAGGLPENVENGATGFVVPRRDPEAMAEKIMLLIQDPKMRESMGKKGRQRAVQLFNAADQIRSFEKFYSDILKT